MVVMPTEWNLRYDAWVIGDGEPDRSVGEVFDWYAVEFRSAEGLAKVEAEPKSAIPVADCEHRVIAEIIYLSDESCIIDFGLRAIASAENLRPGCRQGDYVAGVVGIGLPAIVHQYAPEALFKTLEHRWRVNRVSADLTPYLPHSERSRYFVRDNSHIQYREVDSTRSVRAHSYILHCSEVIG